MNQESGIKNHGRAAAWLVWIGAFFVGAIGAGMILVGETLARPAVILDS